MPHFHIHVHNHSGETTDEEGADYPSLDDAARSAVEGVRAILGEELGRGALDLRGRIEITDADGQTLRVIRFDEVVNLQQDSGRE